MSYNRDEFVRLLTDYYEFCKRVFWDNATIAKAPPGGWPSINQESLANYKRTDTAIDLLRHIPYLDFPGQGNVMMPHFMPETPITDYRLERVQKNIREGKIEFVAAPTDPMPPSCVGIAISQSRNGYWVVLNTDDGYVYWGNPDGQHDEPTPELNGILEKSRNAEAVAWWRGYNVYEPADFFELCKERFRDMSWIGLGSHTFSAMRYNMGWEYQSEPDSDSDEEDDMSHGKLARKMVKAGWPGDGEGRDWDRDKFNRLLGGDESQDEQ